MGSIDIISKPLTQAELTSRYEALIDDPRYSSVQGRLELNAWGQIIMTPPADFSHYRLAARLGRLLVAALGGESVQEAAVACEGFGTLIADVVWCSPAFLAAHAHERVLQRAPEICVEVLSPSNSTKEIDEKTRGYLAEGAMEVWIVDPEGRTIAVHGPEGIKPASEFGVDLTGLFDA
jgi:Uma2 family endonuclease